MEAPCRDGHRRLFRERSCILTVQALAEFVAVATRRGMRSRADAVAQPRDWLRAFPIVAADANGLDGAFAAVEKERFGRFDALLLATARQAGCTIALSEDMHDGARLDGIVVRNPFADQALADDLRPLLGLEGGIAGMRRRGSRTNPLRGYEWSSGGARFLLG